MCRRILSNLQNHFKHMTTFNEAVNMLYMILPKQLSNHFLHLIGNKIWSTNMICLYIIYLSIFKEIITSYRLFKIPLTSSTSLTSHSFFGICPVELLQGNFSQSLRGSPPLRVQHTPQTWRRRYLGPKGYRNTPNHPF